MTADNASPSPSRRRRSVEGGKLVWGLALVVAGGLLMMDRFDYLFLDNLWRFWPLLLVALGIGSFVTAPEDEGRRTGLWLVLIGGWLLVNFFELFGFFWDTSWPLLVIGAGVVSLFYPKEACGRGRFRSGDVRRGRLKALWPLAIGLWLLANTLGIGGLYWDNSWPLALVIIGLLMVVRAIAEQVGGGERRTAEAPEGGDGDER